MCGSPSLYPRRTMQPFNAGRAGPESPMRHESAHARPAMVAIVLICATYLCSTAPSQLATSVHQLLRPRGVTAAPTVNDHSHAPNTPKSPSLGPATACRLSRPSSAPSFDLRALCADGYSIRGITAAPTLAERHVNDHSHAPNTPKSPSLGPATACRLSRPSSAPSFDHRALCADGYSVRAIIAAPTACGGWMNESDDGVTGWSDMGLATACLQ